MQVNIKVESDLITDVNQMTRDALDRRNEIDSQCFLKLSQLLPFIDDSDPKGKEALAEAKELIRERDRANHEFLATLTCRSPKRPRAS
jgi:hypothetical protein